MVEAQSPAQIIRDYLAAAAANVAPRKATNDAGEDYREDASYGGAAVIDLREEMAQRFGRSPGSQPQSPAPARIGRTEKEIMRDTKLPFANFAAGLRQLNNDGEIISCMGTQPSPGAPAGIMEYALLDEGLASVEERRQVMTNKHAVWKMGLGG